MAEYIDKTVALSIREPPKSNRYYQTDNLDDAYEQGWDEALSYIEKIPAADVVPVVHGRWEKQSGLYSCSECGKNCPYDVQADVIEYWACNYCPNCGAKMDGGNQNV